MSEIKRDSETLICNPHQGGCGYRGNDWKESFLTENNECPYCKKCNTGIPVKEFQSDMNFGLKK